VAWNVQVAASLLQVQEMKQVKSKHKKTKERPRCMERGLSFFYADLRIAD